MGLGWELKTLQMESQDTVKPQIVFQDGTLGSHGIYDPPPPPHESGHCVETSTPIPGSCACRAGPQGAALHFRRLPISSR